jgi:Pyruvate/2-oxoacid:ferredoxin oxidoreductase delta subunit
MFNTKPELTRLADIPKVPLTIGDMSHNRTGLWRYMKPVITSRVAPCQQACPLSMPSPDFINDLVQGDEAGALARIMQFNPMPGITGRLCYHPCQSQCLRRKIDTNIEVQNLEKHLADTAPEPAAVASPGSGRRVAVLGAGPLGLTTAYFLGRNGLAVTVLDPSERAGGFLTLLGEDKLTEETLGREIKRLAEMAGLVLKLGAGNQLKFGDDVSVLEQGRTQETWSLIIHDRTAHGEGSEASEALGAAAGRWSSQGPLLDSSGAGPQGSYKASQIALVIAAGRDLAAQALKKLGMIRQAHELESLATGARVSEGGLSAGDLRLELLAEQSPAVAVSGENSALAEAERCFSCGHCNLCGRCLVFCPDVSLSVSQSNSEPEVDEMHCKGCGICAYECPRGAMVMKR